MVDTIAIALVEDAGRYLIGRRGDDVPLAGYWEFPGGKCRPGERPEEAAVRECREETGLEIVVVAVRCRVMHEYDHGTVELHFIDCRLAPGWHAPEPCEGRALPAPLPPFRWVPAKELAEYQFPPANADVVRQLVASAK
jgi:8-oxo-dGTP diphosphatase